MEIDVMLILSIVAYVLGAIYKVFKDKLDTKYIPLQNVVIGVIGALISYFAFDLFDNIGVALLSCISATLTAGGFNGLVKMFEKGE